MSINAITTASHETPSGVNIIILIMGTIDTNYNSREVIQYLKPRHTDIMTLKYFSFIRLSPFVILQSYFRNPTVTKTFDGHVFS